jgi:ATP-dependent DNA helicase RecG
MPESLAWSRLAYDELLAGQLALALVRGHMRRQAGRGSASEGRLRARILTALPYSLTHSQQRARSVVMSSTARSGCCVCCRVTSALARPWWR